MPKNAHHQAAEAAKEEELTAQAAAESAQAGSPGGPSGPKGPDAAGGDAASQADAIAQLIAQRDELQDQLLRNMAEFQNFRKRAQEREQQIRAFATEALIRDLLPVLDNFERSIYAISSGADVEAIREGVQAVDRQLRFVLESQRLERIQAVGAPFDPEHHEAIGHEETEALPEGHVSTEVEAGYKIADRVIRPAKVRVAKKP